MATAAASNDRLGDILMREGLITREQLATALSEQKSTGHRLGYVLVKLGLVQELEVTKVLARQYRMPAVDLSRFEVDPKMLKLVPGDFALKHIVLPLKREGRTLTVAMADPTNTGVLDDLKFITRYDLFPVIAGEYTLRNLLEKHYESSDQQLQTLLKDMEEMGDTRCRGRRGRAGGGRDPGADQRRAGREADQRHPDRRGQARCVATFTSSRSNTRSGCATGSTARCSR